MLTAPLKTRSRARKPSLTSGAFGDTASWWFTAKVIFRLPRSNPSPKTSPISSPIIRAPYLPLGRDFRSRHLFDQIGPSAEKSILLYGNFSTDTHAVRIDLARRVAQLPFAQCDHMGKFLNYSLSREAFFQKVAASKFVLCPRGMGIESYRMWDTLALGAIPIVIREAPFHDQLADLPILFLKRPEEVSELSAHVLETLYAEMRAKQWNFEKLKFDFWLDRIRQALA
jgi:hypothetical protein